MRKSVLIVMLDVMVLSVLSLSVGNGTRTRFLVPIYRWSSVVEEGLAREQEYQALIAELKRKAAEAAKAAMESEIRARVAEKSGAMAAEEIERIRQAEKDAKKLAEQSRKQIFEAEKKAQLAAEREKQAEEKMKDARKRAEEAAKKAMEAEKLAREAELRAARVETGTEQYLKAEAAALKREEAARKQLAKALESEARARGQAKAAEEARLEAEKSAKNSQDYIVYIREVLSQTQAKQKEIELQLKQAKEQKEEVEEVLTQIMDEKHQSIWVRRDKAMRELQIIMAGNTARREATLYLPVLALGNAYYVVSEFTSLELDWRQIQYDKNLSTLSFSISSLEDKANPTQLETALLVPKTEPRITFVPVPKTIGRSALHPIGLQAIKEDRIQRALLFKKELPDERIEVEITPTLKGQYLNVKLSESTSILTASKRRVQPGDYLLTENGRFIGVMADKTHCYVIADAPLNKHECLTLPLARKRGGNHREDFINTAREVKKLIRQMPR